MRSRPLGASTRHAAGALGLLLFVALWWLGSLRYNPVVLPSPFETVSALAGLAARGEVVTAVLQTGVRTILGFVAAAVLGTALGVVAGLAPVFRSASWPVMTVLQGIPPIAWIVLALLWFGTGGATAAFTVGVVTVPFAFIGAVEGVRTVDRGLLEMARAYRAPPAVLLWDVYFPHLLSYLFPMLLTGAAVAWKVAIMAELLGSNDGIGARMALARVNLNTPDALAWIVVVVGLLFAGEYLVLRPLKHHFERWRPAERQRREMAPAPAPANVV